MIRIHKPASPPLVLTNRGAKARAKCCDRFDNGEKQAAPNKKIYGHKTVRDALLKAQNEKCAYCESKVRESAPIDHFRPTSRYYWLAYDWENLLVGCGECNSTYKGERFPLDDESKRATSHHDDLSLESPLLINPTKEDLTASLEWREEVIRAIDGNPRGEATIQILGLNSAILAKNRYAHLKLIKTLLEGLANARSEPQNEAKQEWAARVREELQERWSEAGAFTAMVRAYFKSTNIAFEGGEEDMRNERKGG
jgi:uncharacterized protein (TIGR02646 family)